MIHVVRKLSGTLVRNCCKLLPLGGASIVAEDSFHSSDTIPRISDLVWNEPLYRANGMLIESIMQSMLYNLQ